MASRKEQKEELRAERVEAERRSREATRRRQWITYGVGGVVAAAVIAAIVIVAASGGGSSSSSGTGGAAAFGPHNDGQQDRIVAAKASTMAEPASTVHIHPQLSVYANGKNIEVPANIGIDPGQPPSAMAGLHTHDASGTIHDEGMPPGATLSEFFEIWGVPFSKTELGPYKASGGNAVRMWVDGKPSQAYGDLELEDGQQIVVAYGPKDAPPPPSVEGSG
jgi:hypothetical protein